jgi:hypothetical protein
VGRKEITTDLKAAFTEKLVAGTEWDFDDTRQFCQVSRGDFLDISDSLQNLRAAFDQKSNH